MIFLMAADATAAFKAYLCPEKQQLADTFGEAIHQVMWLQDRQSASLASGGDGLERLDLALRLARKKRDAARTRYESHIRSHGCE